MKNSATSLPRAGDMQVGAMVNHAIALAARGDAKAALPLLQQAARLAPEAWPVHYNLGKVHTALGRDRDAVLAYKRAAKLAPGESAILQNLANALRRDGRLLEAEKEYRRAQVLGPLDGDNHYNLGLTLEGLGRVAEAEEALKEAIRLKPDLADAHFTLALIQLRAGHYADGFAHYEWRWRKTAFSSPARDFGVPQWDGTDPSGKTIIVHTEQGFGDALQFVRFVPVLAERGARVVLEVQKGLLRLLQGYPGTSAVIERHSSPPHAPQLHAPLMSLPHLLGMTLETIPAARRTIAAPPDLVERWRQHLDAIGGPRIGLVWAGNPDVAADAERSPGLKPLLGLLSLKASFVGLQMGPGRRCMEGTKLPANFHDLGPEITDMADTAGIMANLDLVISSCTSPAHLAASLGVPTIILLGKKADWRWLEGREDSPWYPSVRLFRQKRAGDWREVAERVRAHLARTNLAGDPSVPA